MYLRSFLLTIVALACAAAGVAMAQKKPAPAVAQVDASAPRAYKGTLPPLPKADFPLPRPEADVRAVYEFAARRPDVLHYVPCFCGCEQGGHVGNDDCFVKSRDASGKPTAWEVHGMG